MMGGEGGKWCDGRKRGERGGVLGGGGEKRVWCDGRGGRGGEVV